MQEFGIGLAGLGNVGAGVFKHLTQNRALLRERLGYELTVNGKTTRKRIGKRDQFAAELLYFSDCVLKNREPEPSGEEGMQDVRIVQALYESAETGKAVAIPPFARTRRPNSNQRISRPGVPKPQLVHARSATRD